LSKEVYITRLSKFLPNDPISNEEMENYLGLIHDKPSKARNIVLKSNGIKKRYYALDAGGNSTHSNAELAALAVRGLCDGNFSLDEIEVLACGTTSPDQLLPSHASMVHGLLKTRPMETASFSGSCGTGMQALKFACLSIRSGEVSKAVCTGSERTSIWMLSKNFEEETKKLAALNENPIIAFEKDFLRWMLSDGAGAALLCDKPLGDLSLKIEWIENRSYANELSACMYMGADRMENNHLKGWAELSQKEWLEKSIFSLRQDVKILGQNIVPYGTKFLSEIIVKRSFDISTLDYFLPHLSSEFFRKKIGDELEKYDISIPEQKWFTNLSQVGNIGSGSIFVMLEELFCSGKLHKGSKLLLMIPESSRFLYSYCLLSVV
jgi:3-oxoacyl-[acyl-carrier-protein] synthase-3